MGNGHCIRIERFYVDLWPVKWFSARNFFLYTWMMFVIVRRLLISIIKQSHRFYVFQLMTAGEETKNKALKCFYFVALCFKNVAFVRNYQWKSKATAQIDRWDTSINWFRKLNLICMNSFVLHVNCAVHDQMWWDLFITLNLNIFRSCTAICCLKIDRIEWARNARPSVNIVTTIKSME